MIDTSVFQVFWIKPEDDVSFGYINVWRNIESPAVETHYGGPETSGGAPLEYEEWRDWIESNPPGFEIHHPDTHTVKATRIVQPEEPKVVENPKETVAPKKARKTRKSSAN